MRIAIFTETFLPKQDGIVSVLCLFIQHLKAQGVDLVIICPHLGADEPLTSYEGFPVWTVNGVTFPLYPELKLCWVTPGIYSKLKAFQPDLVHLFHPLLVGLPGFLMAKKLGLPIVTSFHVDYSKLVQHYGLSFLTGFTNWATRVIFNHSDLGLAPSRWVQNYLNEIGVQPGRVHLWRRGVDLAAYSPDYYDASLRETLSQGAPDAPLLLYVGRLGPEKRIEDLQAVMEAMPQLRLAIVGDGPSRPALEALFDPARTYFTGYLTGKALSSAYASADLFVFPSALETFGLVVLEAMASGLPVVASRVGGVPDVIMEGERGYSFEIGDQKGLIEGVQKAICDPTHYAYLKEQAYTFALTQSWESMHDEVIDHYQGLIKAQKSAQLVAR